MVANLLKQEIFVREEMVLQFIPVTLSMVHDYFQSSLNTYDSVVWQEEESISIEIGV